MSVTFGIAGVPSLILVKAEGCDGLNGCIESQWECGCEYIDGPGMNVSNANAIDLLVRLGIDTDGEYGIVGSMSVDAFEGHVLAAQALLDDDSGWAPTTTKFATGAQMIDCGRPEGYVGARLATLRDLCTQARSMGAETIDWS